MTVRAIQPADRPGLVSMLAAAVDLPSGISDWYRNAKPPHLDLAAWNAGAIEGVVTGTFGSDFQGDPSFGSLDLPPGPHAFLTRIYVAPAARRRGVGLDLLKAFADEALARRCEYVAGVVDLSSEYAEREEFFTASGFAISDDHMIGALATEVVGRIAQLRR
ncbi:GNAT family N-acetyltransferase [Curtobacterium sp. B18]|uniref:GNAT family N-acetyltransferase n=1 Tax=Curtobacterium sp. B18 TaxID=95614 RepID=UPI0003B57B6F|nr:GNAT family N-acetyltransferase [Curtobacterium sp. B18]